MSDPLITTLIDKFDNFEIIGTKIAEILVVELANQQTLASAASKDPNLWKLRVFHEASNPWSEWIDSPSSAEDGAPIVNVWFNNENVDGRASNVVERQTINAVYNIDCYGYGISSAQVSGHDPGDQRAALEAQRAVRLVRNILMSAHYAYLGMQGTVGKRWVQAIDAFQPQQEQRAVQHIVAMRIQLAVSFNEFSPQVEGAPLELVATTVKRIGSGEVLLQASYPQT